MTKGDDLCTSLEDNQHIGGGFGPVIFREGGTSFGELREGVIHHEYCPDGEYVTCVTIEESGGIESFSFECSGGYESELYRPDDGNGVGTRMCAPGGINAINGEDGGLSDGFFEGFDENGSPVTLEWGTIHDGDVERESCNSNGYTIGFTVVTPDPSDRIRDTLYRLVIRCSTTSLCPLDGVFTENSAESNDSIDVDDESVEGNDSQSTTSSGGTLHVGYFHLFLFFLFVITYFKFEI